MFFQTPVLLTLMATQSTSSCVWRKITTKWPTPPPGSTATQTSLNALSTGGRCWPRRASTWAVTTLRWTSAAREHTWDWPTRASNVRARRATVASRATTSPGACSGMDATSQPGTAMWRRHWVYRRRRESACTWTTTAAVWHSTAWTMSCPWSTSTRQSSWSPFTRPSGCPRKRMWCCWCHREPPCR